MDTRPMARRIAGTLTALLMAGALAACGNTAAPSPTAAPTTAATATSAPAPTPAPTMAPTAIPESTAVPEPTAEPAPGPTTVVLESAAGAPIQIEHPSDWTAKDFGERDDSYAGLPEQSAIITAPEGDAAMIVRYYNYKEPGSGDVVGAYMAIQFNESIDRETVTETTNDDGSIDAEWTFSDPVTKEPMRALVRFLHAEGSPYSFALMFRAPEESFAELAPLGRSMIASFQEVE